MALDTIKEAGTGNSQSESPIKGSSSQDSTGLKATSTPNVDKSSPSITTAPSEDNNATVEAKSPSSTPSEEKTKESETLKDEKLASKFAALSRKERQVVAKQQELKAAESKISEERAKMLAEVESEKAKIQSDLQQIKEFQQLKKMNPLKAMEFLGYNYQQLGEIFLNDGKPTPEQEILRVKSEMEERLESYKREQLESAKKTQEEQELRAKKQAEEEAKRIQSERQQVIEDFQNEITDYITQNTDNYELISTNEQQGLVFSTVEQHFERTGRVLSIKEAADLVEKFLEQQVEKNLATKKLKAKVNPPVAKATIAESKEESQVKSPEPATVTPAKSKTITNDMTSSSLAKPTGTEEERWKRALAALG